MMYVAALLFSILLFAFVAMYYFRSPAFSIYHPFSFYLAFHGLLFVIRPIVAWHVEFDSIYSLYQFSPSDDEKLTALLAAQVGFMAFAWFSLRYNQVPLVFRQDAYLEQERENLRRVFPLVCAICLPVGVYSLARLFLDASLGIAYADMVRDPRTGAAVNTTGNGYLAEAQLMLASTCALLAWLYRFRFLALLPLFTFVVIRAGTGGRGPFITALVTVMLLFLYERRARLPGPLIIPVLLAAVFVFNLVGMDRGRAIRDLIGTEQTVTSMRPESVIRPLEGMDFGNLEYLEYIVHVVPERSGTYGLFLNNLQIFSEPVPRSLWKDKPIGGPLDNIFLFDYGNPIGITRSLPGEGWFNLGWAGVIIWCGLWGWGLSTIYRKFASGSQSTLQVASYMTFLPILIIAFRDGLLITLFRQGIFFFSPIILWWFLARVWRVPKVSQMRARLGGPASHVDRASPRAGSLARAKRRRRYRTNQFSRARPVDEARD